MKKGKKGWLLLMAFTTWAALIAGCGKWTGNKQDKVPEVTMAGSDTENMENNFPSLFHKPFKRPVPEE